MFLRLGGPWDAPTGLRHHDGYSCPSDKLAINQHVLLTLQWLKNVIVAHVSTAVSQTIFSNAFSWMKKYEFRVKSHWNLLLRLQLTISQHWFRYWLGAEEATSHYSNQCWPCLLTHTCFTRPQWVKETMFEGGRQPVGFFVTAEFVFLHLWRSVYQCLSVWRNDTKRQIHTYVSSTRHTKWWVWIGTICTTSCHFGN